MICFFLLLYSARPYFKKMQLLSQDKENGRLDINRAKGFYDLSEYAQAQVGAIKYIQSKTKIDDPIFVGNLRHDKLVNNEVMFYFLSERKSATKYYQFEPGFTTTKVVQQKIVSDLIKTNVQYIILYTVSEEICEPNESCKSSGVKELDSFIQNNYVVENTFRDFLILKHR